MAYSASDRLPIDTPLREPVIHRADSRTHIDLGWLQVRSTFRPSSSQPQRRHFGALVTLDDTIVVAGGKGFGMHPHQDLQILTLVLAGTLEHRDSQGRHTVIEAGHGEIVFAGSGIRHAEFNHCDHKPAELLQFIVTPDQKGMVPRYEVIAWRQHMGTNRLVTVLPNPEAKVPIPVNFALSVGHLDAGASTIYHGRLTGCAPYIFVTEGELEVARVGTLGARDGAGICGYESIVCRAHRPTELLVIEVPTRLN